MSEELATIGYITDQELQGQPGLPSAQRRAKGPVAVIECIQPIPCNPCETSCKAEAISVGEDITTLPHLDEEKCIGCYTCIAICPGQAIFVVDESLEGDDATVAMPYEFLPLPEKGQKVTALDRSGAELGEAEVVRVKTGKRMDQTAMVVIKVPKKWTMKARAFRLNG